MILAVKDLEITDKNTWFLNLPGPTNTWPFLVTFLDGAINLQGFTIRISEEKPTTGYFEPFIVGTDAYFVWAAVLVTNTNTQPMPSSVDEVGFEGMVVNDSVGTPIAPRNVYVAYTVQPWLAGLPTGAYTITSSDFVRTAVGAGFWDIGPSQLTIGGNAAKGNRFNNTGIGITLADFDSSRIDVSFNRLADTKGIGLFAAQGFYVPQEKSSALLIHDNALEANSPAWIWNSGIQIWENFGGQNQAARWQPVQIFANAFEISFAHGASFFDQNAISLVNVSGAAVLGNRVSGTGENAIYVGGDSASNGNTLAGNMLEQFRPHAGKADILLDTTSEYCTVNGSGNNTVTDKGTGNIVNGPRKQ
ncbi:MAG TPA: hypothetical protein VGK29_05280 [Paludibaculum sp.]